jgi:hypothetical protein
MNTCFIHTFYCAVRFVVLAGDWRRRNLGTAPRNSQVTCERQSGD